MKHSILTRICMAAGLILTGLMANSCSKPAEGDSRPVLVVSIEPQRYLLDQLAGDEFRVVALMPRGANPETYDPTLQNRRDVEDAKAYFTIGHLLFEKKLEARVNDKSNFVNTAKEVTPIYGTHDHNASSHETFLPPGCEEENIDPHVWVSVRNSRKIAKEMANRLVVLDPDHATRYSERFQALDHRLDSLDKAYTARLEGAPSKAFMVWHPSLSYFARDYGFEQISVAADSKETSPLKVQQVINEALADSVRIFFAQSDQDTEQSRTIAASAGLRSVPLNTTAYDIVGELNTVVDELTK